MTCMQCDKCSSECTKKCDWCKKEYCRNHYYSHERKTAPNITPLTNPNNPLIIPPLQPQPFNPFSPYDINPLQPHNKPFFGDLYKRKGLPFYIGDPTRGTDRSIHLDIGVMKTHNVILILTPNNP